MSIRPATLEDSRKIWEIRNDPVVRTTSGNAAPFTFEEHDPWFKAQYFNPQKNNTCFVLETEQDGVVGYCRYDFDPEVDRLIVSIALDPNYHGHGYGHRLLSESLALLAPTKTVHAEVKKVNLYSLKLFLKNNFVIYDEDRTNFYLSYSR